MPRPFGNLITLLVFTVIGGAGIYVFHNHFSTEARVRALEDEKKLLEQVVERLKTERRIAKVLVTDQKRDETGVQVTTLLWVEYARDGSTLPAKSFVVRGQMVHLDAMVIKFEHDFVQSEDPLRGHSIALFTRVYGDAESPASAQTIDLPGDIPAIYRGADPRVSQFELDLWTNFWRLFTDDAYRKEKGVRVANGQGVWGPFKQEVLYVITVESDGGVNIRPEPLEGIFREALRRG